MSASTLASWSRAVRRALREAGCDAEALFREAGLDPERLDDPQARYPIARSTKLWRLAVQATGNEAFGLAAARRAELTSFHALGFAVMASPTLGDAFARCARYLAVVSDAAQLVVEPGENETALVIEPRDGDARPAPEGVDAMAAVFTQMCRGRVGRQFAPARVTLCRPAPARVDAWTQVFRCPVDFAAPRNCLLIPAAVLAAPLDSGSPALAAANEAIAAQLLAARQQDDLIGRLRQWLCERLPQGDPGESAAAAALHMSSRSLQRRLAEQGTGYAVLLRETREQLARQYLAQGRHSVSEVAYLLGFADVSTFSRAFKRWTGVAPGVWRSP